MKISLIIPTRSGIPGVLCDNIGFQALLPDEIIEVVGSSLTKQRNAGIKIASGDIVLFIDDDIELDPLYISRIAGIFYDHPDAIAVTGNVQVSMYKTNNLLKILYNLYARFFRILYPGRGRYFLSGFSENYDQKIDKIIKGEMLYGCNMAIRKEVFNEFKFDETIESGMYGEDDFFAYPLSRKYSVYYDPYATCYDDRLYPRGKQSNKIRATFINLYKRHKQRKPNVFMEIAFWWSMIGFTGFKLVEAIIMKDSSIIQGMLSVFKKQEKKEDKGIVIRKYDNSWELKEVKCINKQAST